MTRTINEHIEATGLSKQAIYAQIRAEKLETILIDGVKHIVLKNKEEVNIKAPKIGNCKELVKPYKQIVKRQDKQILHLEKEVEELRNKYFEAMTLMFNSNRQILLSDTVEAEIIEKKKKKKSKKKNK